MTTSAARTLEWSDLDFPARRSLKNFAEKSFLNFTRAWFEIVQGERLLVNWHHQYMASKVDDLIAGRLEPRNLIVNVPPGGTKSEFFSIHLPAYQNVLIRNEKIKRFRNFNISFSDELVRRNSRRTRDIISAPEYQEFWPCSFGSNKAEEWEVINTKGRIVGQTVSRAGGGQITGGRGGFFGPDFSGFVMLDDYNKPDDMFSETKRKQANRRLVNTIRSRRGDKSKEHPTPFVSIQQRLHVEDATGFMSSGGMGVEFHSVVIPALIDQAYIDKLEEPFKTMCWNDIKDSESVEVGGVQYWSYWPEMEDVNDLLALWLRDEYTFLSQYMQKPKKLAGDLIDTDWYQRYSKLPPLRWRAIYVDTNSGKIADHNDFTVFTLAGLGIDGNLYIIDVERGKWDPEDLLKTAIDVWDKWKPTDPKQPARLRYMAIEDKQAGQGLMTTLRKRKKIKIKDIQRGDGQNKLIRCKNSIPDIKSGSVFVPLLFDKDGNKITHTVYSSGEVAGKTNWVPIALKESADFTADDSHANDDIFDTWMDAIDDMLISPSFSVAGMV